MYFRFTVNAKHPARLNEDLKIKFQDRVQTMSITPFEITRRLLFCISHPAAFQ